MPALTLQEWRTSTPTTHPELAGRGLSDDAARRLAASLAASDRLKVIEHRDGLHIETTSWVGTVQLGDLRLTIQPKLQGLPLLNLLRYAYGLRNLRLFEAQQQGVTTSDFTDLLIHQLSAEASELLARGLHRHYERQQAFLASPRGRIDFAGLARSVGTTHAALPCTHHPRQEDILLNRAILGGINLGVRLTGDLALRTRLRRLAALLADGVTATPATPDLLRRVRRESSRLTAAYRPALAIIELLVRGQGIALDQGDETIPVPGFLFDMNRFFQALISRHLHDHLPGHTVRDEHRLVGILAYDPSRNPRHRRAPTPRPDFVVQHRGRTIAVLDAKYRDLWETPIPRSMLYQLVIYASSSAAAGRATILYPTLDPLARDACVEVHDPVAGSHRAEVITRPVNLFVLEGLVTAPGSVQKGRAAITHALQLLSGARESTRVPATHW